MFEILEIVSDSLKDIGMRALVADFAFVPRPLFWVWYRTRPIHSTAYGKVPRVLREGGRDPGRTQEIRSLECAKKRGCRTALYDCEAVQHEQPEHQSMDQGDRVLPGLAHGRSRSRFRVSLMILSKCRVQFAVMPSLLSNSRSPSQL